MTPAKMFPVVMMLVWGIGAAVQIEMTREGLAYPHGYIYAAIMGLGSLAFLGLFLAALKLKV